eukprot:TRINITY_DN5588_c0_g2_i2.p1 TRINITY_DN5588_c0_g2~~TRINITY_DN5588_c0_g2_i2.p1  ORF type:complete len:499 (+),score=108.74 TRINITY_DN5588_c0_g2_i2:166-1662(+)
MIEEKSAAVGEEKRLSKGGFPSRKQLKDCLSKPLASINERYRIYFVIIFIAFTQGILGLADLSVSYLYKDDFKMTPAQVSAATGITSLPWIVKPLWGFISDGIPFLGYRRKSYLVFFGATGFICWTLLSRYNVTSHQGVFLLLCVQLGVAFSNAIGEALLVEISKDGDNNAHKSDEEKQGEASKNVSLFFSVRSFGYLLTTYTGGVLLEIFPKREIFTITSLFPLALAAIAWTLPEKAISRVPSAEYAKVPHEDTETAPLADAQPRDSGVASPRKNIKRVLAFIRLPQLWKPILFIFVFQMTPSPSSAMFFFYTNGLKFAPEFMGQLKFIQSIANISGIWFYHRFLKFIAFKKIFSWSAVGCFFSGMTQILLVTRYNVDLGIPDKAFCLTDSLILQTITEINTIPILVMACRFCPKNIEGTMYALLMAALNFGTMISVQLGGLLIAYLGITESNFSSLWILILIANVTSVMTLPFLGCVNFEAAQELAEKRKLIEEVH